MLLAGFEPARISPTDFKSAMSADSITGAYSEIDLASNPLATVGHSIVRIAKRREWGEGLALPVPDIAKSQLLYLFGGPTEIRTQDRPVMSQML